ncbi:hypothetical protein [Streptomyces sp. NPDC058622]
MAGAVVIARIGFAGSSSALPPSGLASFHKGVVDAVQAGGAAEVSHTTS